MKRILAKIALITVLSSGLAVAQEGPASAAKPAAAPAAETPSVDTSPAPKHEQAARTAVINQFKAAEARNEELRYKHLWIAYSMVWILVFVFVLRTWKLNNTTTAELDSLKRRLAKLEADDGA